jgi:glycosyltransferase involved in cell wall biosynthesis
MTNNLPAISVLMSAYNSERYVRQAVESILNQTFRDFELILIDDGSKDASPAILKALADRDSRIRLIARENKGLTRTLNEAFSLARAPLVARMDADDVSMPERFAKQVAYLSAHSECVCVGSRVDLIDPLGSVFRTSDHKLAHQEIDAGLLKGIGWSIVHPVAMMRRDAIEKVGGYREQFETSQDLDLFLRLGEIGKLANLPDVLLQYRQHFESVAFHKHEKQWKVKETIVGDAYNRRGLTPPSQWPFEKRVVHSPSDQLRQWAWAAIKRGKVDVARRHAWAGLKLKPFSKESWRVAYCALRGR